MMGGHQLGFPFHGASLYGQPQRQSINHRTHEGEIAQLISAQGHHSEALLRFRSHKMLVSEPSQGFAYDSAANPEPLA